MLKPQQKLKGQKGFTIIEVLIVLAIAGLILLIVFLAVPALQRNSRNTTVKNSAQNVLGGVAEFQGANNGGVPTAITGVTATGVVSYTGAAGTNTTTINVPGGTAVSSTTAAPAAAAPALNTIVVSIGFKCNGSGSGRAVAALYSIETSAAAPVRQCAES